MKIIKTRSIYRTVLCGIVGKGNITPSAEFNFHTDPEAAQVVLNELGCPITMACWELCLKHSFPWVSTYWIITARIRSMTKVMFSVCLLTGGAWSSAKSSGRSGGGGPLVPGSGGGTVPCPRSGGCLPYGGTPPKKNWGGIFFFGARSAPEVTPEVNPEAGDAGGTPLAVTQEDRLDTIRF